MPDSSRASGRPDAVWDWTPMALALYDPLVLGVFNRLTWGCPTPRILDLYNRLITDNHLDVGVGTGWYLDRCRFPTGEVRLGLMDVSEASLQKAERRLRRYGPQVVQADVLKPIDLSVRPFNSVSMTYLLHCLPGDLRQKAVVFDHLRPLLAQDGVLFGATLLSSGVACSGPAMRVMKHYNKRGMFSNEHDSLSALRQELSSRFDRIDIQTFGCAALFSARP